MHARCIAFQPILFDAVMLAPATRARTVACGSPASHASHSASWHCGSTTAVSARSANTSAMQWRPETGGERCRGEQTILLLCTSVLKLKPFSGFKPIREPMNKT
eukprot:scaffold53891_cov37-Tisochrysis_lutea.AAC.1